MLGVASHLRGGGMVAAGQRHQKLPRSVQCVLH